MYLAALISKFYGEIMNRFYSQQQVSISSLWIPCCFQNQFRTVGNIRMLFRSSFFLSISLESIQPYSSTDTTTAWKNSHLCYLRDYFPNDLSMALRACSVHMLILLPVDVIMLPRYVRWFTNFKGLAFMWRWIYFV